MTLVPALVEHGHAITLPLLADNLVQPGHARASPGPPAAFVGSLGFVQWRMTLMVMTRDADAASLRAVPASGPLCELITVSL